MCCNIYKFFMGIYYGVVRYASPNYIYISSCQYEGVREREYNILYTYTQIINVCGSLKMDKNG